MNYILDFTPDRKSEPQTVDGHCFSQSQAGISLIVFIRAPQYLLSYVSDIAAAPLDPTLLCLGSIRDRDAAPIPPKVSFWVYRMQEAKG